MIEQIKIIHYEKFNLGIQKASEFKKEDEENYTFEVLGGNHRLTVYQELDSDGFQGLPDEVPAILYFGKLLQACYVINVLVSINQTKKSIFYFMMSKILHGLKLIKKKVSKHLF